MIVTTTEFVLGYEEVLGVVFGNTVGTKHLGKDILANLKNLSEEKLRNNRNAQRRQNKSFEQNGE